MLKKTKSADSFIFTGNNVLSFLHQLFLKPEYTNSKLFVIADENTKKYCLPLLTEKVKLLRKAGLIEIKSGEEYKNTDTVIYIIKKLLEAKADRNSVVINLGGGVICDMGGFAASVFKRGIRYINIPTTLLAQVDASFGGKVGVDIENFKNQIGVFNNPASVFICPLFLKTLPKKHLLAGYAEMLKHSLIADKEYWNTLKKRPFDKIKEWDALIYKSVEIKNSIVKKDPYEKNIRKKLNFGHTIGHAVETYSLANGRKHLLHGEAVAAGLICESYISYKCSGLSKAEFDDITKYIYSNFSHYNFNKTACDEIISIMEHDKKNTNGKINLTLIQGIGKPLINQNCSKKIITESLEYYSQFK